MRAGLKLFLLMALLVLASSACSSRGLDLDQSRDQLQFGVQMAKANLWREAMFRFERAVEIDPNNPNALNNLAVAYEGIGEFEKARDTYARALAADRSNQYIQKNYSRFVEFYSRNQRREEQLQSRAAAAESEAEAPAEEAAPAEPPLLSDPPEPPRPGEIPVSQEPPTPELPVTPPPGGVR
jgi:type IV pilus assembly protein PilF